MENNFTHKFLKLLLNGSGIALECQTHRIDGKIIKVWKYYLLYAFIFLTSSQVITLKNIHSFYDLCMTLIFIFNGIFLNCTTLMLHVKKHNLLKMLKIFEKNFVEIAQQSGLPQNTNDRFKSFFFSYGLMSYGIFALVILSPFLFFPISGNKLGDVNTLLIPCWFPWKIDTYPKYLSTIALQFSWLAALCTPISFGFLFTSYFVFEVQCKRQMLEDFVIRMKLRDVDQGYEDFKTFIRYHQVIWRFIKNFCSCYGLVFATNLMYSSANFTLILLAFKFGDKTVPAMMQLITVFVMVTSYLFLYCYIGEVISDMNEKIRTMLYDIEWFKQSRKFKKLLILFLCLRQHDSNLKIGVSYVASFRLLSQILRMSYSYFNVLSKT